MSSWKLVEAVPEEASAGGEGGKAFQQNGSGRGGYGGGRGGRGNRGGFKGRGRGRGNNNNAQPYNMTMADRNYAAYMAVQQIELLFYPDNLCMDTFIRSYMDEAGFVPIALVCGYPNVACCFALYPDIISRLQQNSATNGLEVDAQNETIRIQDGWDKWLMPNPYSTTGKGCPRYFKQAQQNQGFDGNGDMNYGMAQYFVQPNQEGGQNVNEEAANNGEAAPAAENDAAAEKSATETTVEGGTEVQPKILVGDILVESMGTVNLSTGSPLPSNA